MPRLNSDMTVAEIVDVISEEHVGALMVVAALATGYPGDLAILFARLDHAGIYGPALWDLYQEHGENVEELATAIFRMGEGQPPLSIVANELETKVQEMDDAYFEEHPKDDYYVRPSIPGELARAGYPDYNGNILVYIIQDKGRLRRPVVNVDDAIKFMVDFEKNLES